MSDQAANEITNLRFFNVRQLSEVTTLSRAALYRQVKAGKLAPTVPLCGRRRAWRAVDVKAFLMLLNGTSNA
jgi:predicted DNA-binding transcriptional regulator AlpA